MQHHIVAANIDQSFLIVTLKDPRTSQGFIDRWLVTCEAYHVPAVLLFNKTDLYRKKKRKDSRHGRKCIRPSVTALSG
jgi:ribosome biogenesis GTPase